MKFIFKKESKFFILFLISTISIIVPGLFKESDISEIVFDVIFSIMVIASTFAIANTKKHHKKILFIGSLTLVFTWLLLLNLLPFEHPRKLGTLPLFFFFTYTVVQLIRTILQSKDVTPDVIFGAITGYIFMGYAAGFYFGIINGFYPHSFSFPSGLQTMSLVYYSFVTMTTLGFGDIVPVSNAAKGGTILLSILGQFYIAIVVALLVSKYLIHANKK